MHKLRIAVLLGCLSLVVAFSACGTAPAQETESKTPDRVNGVYQISCDDFSFVAELKADRNRLEIVFREPVTLAGYRLTCSAGAYTYEMCGVTSNRQTPDVRLSAVPARLYALTTSLFSTGGTYTPGEAGGVYQTAGVTAELDADGQVQSFRNTEETVQAQRIPEATI